MPRPRVFRAGAAVYLFGRVTFRTVNLIPAKRTPEAACRAKPWGTGHALACCKGVVNGPFAVINADDFYGRTAFSEIYDFLAAQTDESCYADSNEMQA